MSKDSDFISDVKGRFDDNVSWTRDIRDKFKKNSAFVLFNDQWGEEDKRVRTSRGRPALTFNFLQSFAHNVLNVNLSHRPGVAIKPADRFGNEKAAQILMSICRGIERNSNADLAYRRSIMNLVLCGYSFIELEVKYKHTLSFEREVLISEVKDPRNVVADISAIWGGRPPNYAYRIHFLTEAEFEDEYPGKNMVSFCEESDQVGYAPFDGDRCQLVDYWTRTKKQIEILKLRTVNQLTGRQESRVMSRDQMLYEGGTYLVAMGENPEAWSNDDVIGAYLSASQAQIEGSRKSDQYEIKKRTLSGDRILKEEIFPGDRIPIVMGHMDMGLKEDRLDIMDLISSLIDVQSMMNYAGSKQAEQSGKAINPLILGPVGFIPRGKQSNWDYLNMMDQLYQEYDPSAGPPPQIWSPPTPAQDPVPELAWQYLQRISGHFDSQMGAPSNEISGVAISKREEQGQNTSSSLRLAFGNQTIDLFKIMIPLIVDVYQDHDQVETVSEAEKSEMLQQPLQEISREEGINLRQATWNMTVVKGPPFSTQQEEAVSKIVDLAKLNPEILRIAGDLIVSNMRFSGSDVLQRRIESLLPEEIKESERLSSAEKDDPQTLKMKLGEASVQVNQLAEQVKQLTQINQELSSASALIQQKEQRQHELKQAELLLKEKETEAKIAADRALKEEQIQAEELKLNRELAFKEEQNALDRQHELDRLMLSKRPMDTEEFPTINLVPAAEGFEEATPNVPV